MSGGHIPTSLQRRVRLRASDRCEYCRLAQAGQEATFHIDHVVPRVAGGATALENLALACVLGKFVAFAVRHRWTDCCCFELRDVAFALDCS